MSEERYLVACVDRTKASPENVVWWGPNHCGYTTNVDEAGRYTWDESKEICQFGKGRYGRPAHVCFKESELPEPIPVLNKARANYDGKYRMQRAAIKPENYPPTKVFVFRDYVTVWLLAFTEDHAIELLSENGDLERCDHPEKCIKEMEPGETASIPNDDGDAVEMTRGMILEQSSQPGIFAHSELG